MEKQPAGAGSRSGSHSVHVCVAAVCADGSKPADAATSARRRPTCRTVLSNLVLLCRRHHRAVHEGGWRIEGDPAATLRFIRPEGFALPNEPPPLREDRRDWLRRHLPTLGTIPKLAFDPG